MGQKKMVHAALAAAMAAGAVVVATPMETKANTPSFHDVPQTHQFYKAITELASRGVIGGYPDGTFKPGQSISRQHASVILAKALKLDTENVKNPGFKDVPPTHPYYKQIAALVEAGVISGYEKDQTFRPKENLTRAQMAKMLVVGFGLEGEQVQLPFTDVNEKQWHVDYVRALYSNEITTGSTPKTFAPNDLVTRGQMAAFIYRSELATGTKESAPEPVDEDLKAVERALDQIKDGTVQVSKGTQAPANVKLQAVQTYVNNLLNEAGVQATVTATTTEGSYEVILQKGQAELKKTIEMKFDYGADDRFVTEIKLDNAKQMTIRFSSPVLKSTVLDNANQLRNISFTMVTGATVNPGQLTGELSSDGKTLTITAQWIFDGEYAFKTTNQITDERGQRFEESTTIVKAEDKVGPQFVSGSATGKTSANTFSILFDEPVTASGVVAHVDDVAATVRQHPTDLKRLEVTSTRSIATGTAAKIRLLNVKDYKNNLATPNPIEATVTVVADTAKPTVKDVKVIGENRIEVTYDKEMNVSSFQGKARIVYGNGTVTNLRAERGKDAKTVILSGSSVPMSSTSQAVLFIDENVLDTVGNQADKYSLNVTLEKDTTPPSLKAVEYRNNEIVVTFTEEIELSGNRTISIIDQSTGRDTPISLSSQVSIAHDTLTIPTNLKTGSYILRLPANTVRDKAGRPNVNSLLTQQFYVEYSSTTDYTRPEISNIRVQSSAGRYDEQVVTYTVTDRDSGVDLSSVQDLNNYTWDGQPLPNGSFVTTKFNGNANQVTSVDVNVHVPTASVTSSKRAPFVIHNIRDNAGNTIASPAVGQIAFTYVDYAAPELVAAKVAPNGQLLVTFSEPVHYVGASDFDIKIGSEAVPENAIRSVNRTYSDDRDYVITLSGSIADNVTYRNQVRDILYIDRNGNGRFDEWTDIIIEDFDQWKYNSNQKIDIDFNSTRLYNGISIRLVRDSSPIKDYQGNEANYNNRDVYVNF